MQMLVIKQDHENLIIEMAMNSNHTEKKTHQDHMEDRSHGSMSRYHMVHTPISFFKNNDNVQQQEWQ